MITTLTHQQLRKAAALKEKINILEKELARIFPKTAPAHFKTIKKSAISSSARRKIAAAKKAHWVKFKKAKSPTSVPTNNPGTRRRLTS